MHFRSKQRRRAGPEARRQPAAHPLWSDNFHPRPLTSSLGLPPQSPPPSFSPSSSCRLTICLRSASERRAVLFQFSSRAPPPSSLSPRLPKRQNSLCLRGGDGRRKERDADVGSCVIPSPELCIFLFVTAASRRRVAVAVVVNAAAQVEEMDGPGREAPEEVACMGAGGESSLKMKMKSAE